MWESTENLSLVGYYHYMGTIVWCIWWVASYIKFIKNCLIMSGLYHVCSQFNILAPSKDTQKFESWNIVNIYKMQNGLIHDIFCVYGWPICPQMRNVFSLGKQNYWQNSCFGRSHKTLWVCVCVCCNVLRLCDINIDNTWRTIHTWRMKEKKKTKSQPFSVCCIFNSISTSI